jgi:HEAT repeat protein
MQKFIVTAALCGSMLCGFKAWCQPSPKPLAPAWEVLQKGLQDSNPEKRKMTAAALAGAGTNSQAIQMLYDAMNDKDPEVRQTAATSLGEMRARVAIPKLKAAMENDPEVSFLAARSLWLMGDHSGRDVIEEVATGRQKNPTGKVSQAKLEASRKLHDPNGLAKMGALGAADALLGPFSIGLKLATDFAKDSGAQARLLAITLISRECDTGSAAAIQTAFEDDKNEIVRAAAAKALGTCGGNKALQQLTDAVSSEKFSVQIWAAASLIRISSAPAAGKGPAPASLKKK